MTTLTTIKWRGQTHSNDASFVDFLSEEYPSYGILVQGKNLILTHIDNRNGEHHPRHKMFRLRYHGDIVFIASQPYLTTKGAPKR